VLLVEDSPGERWVMAEILRSRGHAVTLCESAAEAWTRFSAHGFPLVVLDWNLPGGSCAELCGRIRSTPESRRTSIVVMAEDDPKALEEVLGAGADDFVTRPVDVGRVHVRLAVVERMVRESDRRRLVEEALADANVQLQRANDELESFAWTVSHDLKAPLRTMQGFAHKLLDDYGARMDDRGRDFARRIVASGTRSEALIRDLLEYSRLSFERIEVKPVELQAVLHGAMELMEADLRKAGARIMLEDDLPRVLGHHTILQQVITNLLTNAVKFVPEGRKPEIRIWAEKREDHIRLFVQDNGVGVPPDQADRIFRTFERLAESLHQDGTGIGLAIVRRGMERIGGAAGVEPAPEAGSRFWLDIPRAD
jgi:signal transduction histidine kinase